MLLSHFGLRNTGGKTDKLVAKKRQSGVPVGGWEFPAGARQEVTQRPAVVCARTGWGWAPGAGRGRRAAA